MRYGLDKITSIEGTEVTDAHRESALSLTQSEALDCMDEAAQGVSPHLRKYGGTVGVIMESFLSARGIIEDEMSRLARRNLEAVVTGSMAGRRVLNLEIYTAEKEARAAAENPESMEGDNAVIDDPDFLN